MTGGFGGDADFSSLGKPRVKPPRPEKPDPEQLQISSRELNTQLRQGKTVDEYDTPAEADAPQFGAPGYQWRMMKLKRTIEAAESEGRRLEEVALERYASLEDFERAREEKRYLDGKGGPKQKVGEAGRGTPTLQSVARRSYLLASGGAGDGEGSSRSGTASEGPSRPGSRQAFRRPGESSNPSTPTPAPAKAPRNIGFETPSSTPATPTAIPSVFTPVIQRPTHSQPPNGIVLDDGSSDPDRPILTADQLNKLQAKIMQAELMGSTNLDTLRAEYDSEKARAEAHRSAGDRGGAFGATSGDTKDETVSVLQDGDRQLQVLPTLDARGRMYDIGSSTGVESTSGVHSDSRRKARKASAVDNEDDSSLTLSDLVRQERFSAGPSSLKNIDATLATSIMTDTHFSADLEEQDNSASRYASSRKANADALKRQFAINDFARTQRALEKCRFCFRNQGSSPPRVALVSSGYRAYLCIPDKEAVAGEEDHVQIVPMQHHLSLLEADDDTWEEMRNFQKCLAQLASSQGKVVVFYETLVSIKAQQHAVMEAILLKKEVMDRLPGVFKESLREVGGEWSTHRKVIEFSPEKPFRRALVPQLPYFAVTWDYRWSTGYGHIIEDPTGGNEGKEEANAYDVDEMAAGGGTGARGMFDPNFARDVIRGVLEDLDADDDDGYVRSFGRDKVRSEGEKQRIKQVFKKGWDKVDWTKMLENGGGS
ncbi:Cell cycle control protein [Pseudozyma hubeiensis]|nr:Cell cycle control protein [Pseudozyma hubeiensis]